MRHLKSFVTVFGFAWIAGAATVVLALSSYATEDFSLPDLIPILTLLTAFGVLLTGALLMPLLLFLRPRLRTMQKALVYPVAGALVAGLPVAAATGFPALRSGSLPIAEAVLFTAAFLALGFSFGLIFLAMERVLQRVQILLYALLIPAATAAAVFAIPFAEEALLASPRNGFVTRAGAMREPRSAHTATLLADGRVLLAGGMISVRGAEVSTSSTEIYDPGTGELTSGPAMSAPRAGHTATLLATGDVLITGGTGEQNALTSAELCESATGRFTPVGLMTVRRERHSATRLADGRILIAGGTVAQPSDVAELYDPSTRTFVPASRMTSRRAAHSATLLRNGQVLLAGGAESLESVLRKVELYDPARNAFQVVGQMQVNRYKHSAVLLADGTVMLLGGADERDWSGRRQSVEIYDPSANRSQFIAPMNRARFKFAGAVAVASNGNVIVSGGGRRVEIYEYGDRFSVSGGSVGAEWFYATATPLADGRVLIAGGYNDSLDPTNQAWIYQPSRGDPPSGDPSNAQFGILPVQQLNFSRNVQLGKRARF